MSEEKKIIKKENNTVSIICNYMVALIIIYNTFNLLEEGKNELACIYSFIAGANVVTATYLWIIQKNFIRKEKPTT